MFDGQKHSFWSWNCFKHFQLVFERFVTKNLRDLKKNALTRSVFELEKFSFFLNWSEFARNWLVPLSGCQSGTFMHSLASNNDKACPHSIYSHTISFTFLVCSLSTNIEIIDQIFYTPCKIQPSKNIQTLSFYYPVILGNQIGRLRQS